MHSDLEFLVDGDFLGPTTGPANFAEELIEYLDSQFMFERTADVWLPRDIAEVLREFDVDPFGSTGQYILQTLLEHVDQEFFGDFERWAECESCGNSFSAELSLGFANAQLLDAGMKCDNCR